MKTFKIYLGALLVVLSSTFAQAQTLKLGPENGTAEMVIATNAYNGNNQAHVVELGYNDFATVALSSNYTFHDIQTDDDWLSWKIQKNGNLAIFANPNYNLNEREGVLYITRNDKSEDIKGLYMDMIRVVQKGKNTSDKKLTIKSGTAS